MLGTSFHLLERNSFTATAFCAYIRGDAQYPQVHHLYISSDFLVHKGNILVQLILWVDRINEFWHHIPSVLQE